MSTSLQRLLSEALGTFTLVFFGATAAASAASGAYGQAVAYTLALTLAVWLVGGVSGAHLNPAITLVMAARNRFAWRDVPGYVVAQLVGGIAGSLLIWAAVGTKGAGLGATSLSAGTNVWEGLLAEALAGFLLGAAYYAFHVQGRLSGGLGALGVGLAYGTGILALGGFTGASANLARSVAPQVTLALSGGKSDWSDMWVYLVGPVVGILVGVLVVDTVLKATAEAKASD
ncbi:porin [Longispora fulva]|uniref:Glycerol uptake facilitator protein n=1 Tax=Longispora fulva TaxID=619741 RepID=A0A8J7GUX4_9ACTN|nr:aquaporin [Longispora fulva]MBG6137866.1 glycerol uptake facilitator protein [Longispora fulva]GIG60120.1 porin [Longispora fulva]